jgi:hypothetical protein
MAATQLRATILRRAQLRFLFAYPIQTHTLIVSSTPRKSHMFLIPQYDHRLLSRLVIIK